MLLPADQAQDEYIRGRQSLLGALHDSKTLLSALAAFNRNDWIVKYPQLRDHLEPSAQRRSLSFADDPSFETDVLVDTDPFGPCLSDCERRFPTDELAILRLDLKLGAHTSPDSVAALVTQLEKASIAKLIDARITDALSHVDKLRLRVEDTSSKVLVTGDVNAGKSTFVNALLRRQVMSVDQQPCTTAFCQVHDAVQNQGREEVHIVKECVVYDTNDDATYTKAAIDDLEEIMAENTNTEKIINVYLDDTRAPSESLLNNGVVDISLIDAPGLNRDSMKTTAVFSRQEEIDVVVFVVSAENHFTLSGREFLKTASQEKAFIFIVVNKFEQIRNKDRCRRAVLEQIKQISPRTFDEAHDLVHFVDSAVALQPCAVNPAFDDLESALRSFVLVKRAKSKLHPVATYLSHLLLDVQVITTANLIVADNEIQLARDDLSTNQPVLDKMKSGRGALRESLEKAEEDGVYKSLKRTKDILGNALDRVGQGKLGADRSPVAMPSYPGFLGIWGYARDVRKALLLSLDAAVRRAEDEARIIAETGINRIRVLENNYLPEGVERDKRMFTPEVMFTAARKRARGVKGRRPSSIVVAGGLHGLGIGLAQKQAMLETTFFDLFDLQYKLSVCIGSGKEIEGEDAPGPTTWSFISISVGALTMVGGHAIGVRGLIEGFMRVTNLVDNESARKWVAPILGAATLGLTAYVILDLPSSVPRTVGRRIRASLMHSDGGKNETYVEMQAERVSKETRKVLRAMSVGVDRKFDTAIEDHEETVRDAAVREGKALKAKERLAEFGKKSGEIRGHLNTVA
ncbi:hypothetical protein APHAL10511_002656 [Amanita phalloides]|nr:hypothetical protein APHAL10511_002656 [Amanita phalloides]